MNQRTKYYYKESSHEEFNEELHSTFASPVKNLLDELSIKQLIEKLDRGTQQILRFYYYDGKTLKKIAELTGLSREGVRKIRDKGISLLREKFQR